MNNIDLEFYKKYGWVLIKDAINNQTVDTLKEKGLRLRKWVEDKIGTPSEYGPPTHWQGIGCAGMYDPDLYKFYQSKTMFSIASYLLEKEDIWLFNDQMVIKLPEDDFGFDIHRDNQFVQGNENGETHTVNLGIVLDDFTDLNGTLEIKDNNDEWQVIYPTKGDIVAINGNTPHCSSPNYSEDSRGLYACVYSEGQLNSYNFYTSKFSNIYEDGNTEV